VTGARWRASRTTSHSSRTGNVSDGCVSGTSVPGQEGSCRWVTMTPA
jgi:hypothetical protein